MVTGAVVPPTAFPNVPVNVAEPITKPAGKEKLKLAMLAGGRGNEPPTVKAPLKSGRVTVIVSALVAIAEARHKITNRNVGKKTLREQDISDSSLLLVLFDTRPLGCPIIDERLVVAFELVRDRQ
jgi:hypothetical protein